MHLIKEFFSYKRNFSIAIASAAIALLVGCGGSSSEPLTKAEYLKQATAICKKSQAELLAKVQKYEKERKGLEALQSRDELKEMSSTLIGPAMQARGEELSELSSPDGDEEKTEAIVAGFEQAVEANEKEPLAFLSVVGPAGKLEKLTKAYGLEICGQLGA